MRICDRCGNNSAVFELLVIDNRPIKKVIDTLEGILLWKTQGQEPLDRVDLCEKCYEEFQGFVKEAKSLK